MNNPKFSFNFISFEQNLEEINKLTKKASQTTDIPLPIIKGNKHVMALFIYLNFNNSLSSSFFSAVLKYSEVRPVFKKMTNDKENCRPISILRNISKVYERFVYYQLYPCFNQIFPKLQCGFRKCYNAEQYLISMIEK